MKVLIIFSVCLCAGAVLSSSEAEICSQDKCSIENNCRCPSTVSPLTDGETPQFIVLTIHEAVVDTSFWNFWKPLLFDRKNPDGKPISATFFVPHRYTDYVKVQELYLRGFEIGDGSVTQNSTTDYWTNSTEENLIPEFDDQRTIISHFANIPDSDITGGRAPLFFGDALVDAYTASGLQYDNSWPTPSTFPFFPYTLDFRSTQPCINPEICPTVSHPGFWVAPIIYFQTPDGEKCHNLYDCLKSLNGTADEISEWLNKQIEKTRSNNKAPLTVWLSSSFFQLDNAYEGFWKFLDGLPDDVFLVSWKQVLDWVKNPVPLDQFQTEVVNRTATCNPVNCGLLDNEGNEVYMMSCVDCPAVYPWKGNPLGN